MIHEKIPVAAFFADNAFCPCMGMSYPDINILEVFCQILNKEPDSVEFFSKKIGISCPFTHEMPVIS